MAIGDLVPREFSQNHFEQAAARIQAALPANSEDRTPFDYEIVAAKLREFQRKLTDLAHLT